MRFGATGNLSILVRQGGQPLPHRVSIILQMKCLAGVCGEVQEAESVASYSSGYLLSYTDYFGEKAVACAVASNLLKEIKEAISVATPCVCRGDGYLDTLSASFFRSFLP